MAGAFVLIVRTSDLLPKPLNLCRDLLIAWLSPNVGDLYLFVVRYLVFSIRFGLWIGRHLAVAHFYFYHGVFPFSK